MCKSPLRNAAVLCRSIRVMVVHGVRRALLLGLRQHNCGGIHGKHLSYCLLLCCAASRVVLRAGTFFHGKMGRWWRQQCHYDCERHCLTSPGCEPTWQYHATLSSYLIWSVSPCLPLFLSARLSVPHLPPASPLSHAASLVLPFSFELFGYNAVFLSLPPLYLLRLHVHVLPVHARELDLFMDASV